MILITIVMFFNQANIKSLHFGYSGMFTSQITMDAEETI